ncbi:MAG: TRAP transporter substrate-binding protein [Alphaproteobacteria bacterium]|nr:TRAP transporter substrate-binding protein [Alphaproteobacteria bacterium]
MTLRIRAAGYQGERSVHTRAMRVLLHGLQERTGGSVAAEFEPNVAARSRKAADLLGMVEHGELDLCYFSSSYLAARVPALVALDVPFLFEHRNDTRARLTGALGALIRRDVAAHTGYEVLALWDNGLRHISNARRQIRTPEDCAGLRIRTLPSEGYHATFRALGMTPVTIDVADMMRAIEAGEVDAQENPLTNVQLFGIQKHHPFVTLTGHFHGIALVLCNAAAWAGWPAEFRAALSEALEEATQAQWRFSVEDDVSCRAALEGEGVRIADLDPGARAAFRSAVSRVAGRLRSALPADVAAQLD